MKREKKKIEEKKSYKFPLSDVFEVTFLKDTNYHKAGDKKLVSLSVAIKFVNDGKVSITQDIQEAINKYEMNELLSVSKKGKIV